MFRNYKVFTRNIYRICIWLLYPLAAIAGCALILKGGVGGLPTLKGFGPVAVATVLVSCMSCVEIIQDAFLFSGSQSKDRNYMEFLKVSEKGMKVYRNALIADILRRAFTIAIVFVANVWMGMAFFGYSFDRKGVTMCAICALWTFVISTGGVYFARFFASLWVNVSVAYAISFIGLICMIPITKIACPDICKMIIIAAMAVGLGFLSVRTVEKKVEESYYDERNETGNSVDEVRPR